MYITMEDYTALYDAIEEKTFNRIAFEACRIMDDHTTGIDGVKKLQKYFPAEEYDAVAVKHCTAKLVNILYQIQAAEKAADMGRGYTETEQGLQRKIISRVESGSEAISYSEIKTDNTAIDLAAADTSARFKLLASVIREFLSGVTDANGINLLYMGPYPMRYRHV